MAYRITPNIKVNGGNKSKIVTACQKTHYRFYPQAHFDAPGIQGTANYVVGTGQRQYSALVKQLGSKKKAEGWLLRIYLKIRYYGMGEIKGAIIRFDCVAKKDAFYLFNIWRRMYKTYPCKAVYEFSWTRKKG